MYEAKIATKRSAKCGLCTYLILPYIISIIYTCVYIYTFIILPLVLFCYSVDVMQASYGCQHPSVERKIKLVLQNKEKKPSSFIHIITAKTHLCKYLYIINADFWLYEFSNSACKFHASLEFLMITCIWTLFKCWSFFNCLPLMSTCLCSRFLLDYICHNNYTFLMHNNDKVISQNFACLLCLAYRF